MKFELELLQKQGMEICIYCVGAYGMRTYLALRDHVVSYIDINNEIEMIYGSINYTQPNVINYIDSFRKNYINVM